MTATSIGQMFDDLGGAVSYFIAVLMTPQEPTSFPNSTGTSEVELVGVSFSSLVQRPGENVLASFFAFRP